jgi:hypothetical protein
MDTISHLRSIHGLIFGVCCLLSAQAPASTVEYPRLETQKINGLVAMKFPPELSNVNCHATSMVATGVLTVLLPLPNDEVYFKSGCFMEVPAPAPGDVGFFVDDSPPLSFALHSITYVSPSQIFQKENPGWKFNPWEITAINGIKDVPNHFSNYHQAKLKWGRYRPGGGCFLTQFQMWIDQNRSSGIYAPMIQVLEERAAGNANLKADPKSFAPILAETERLSRASTLDETQAVFQSNQRHLLHEYLILPEFKAQRAAIESQRLPVGTTIAQYLKQAVAKSKTVSDVVKKIFSAGQTTYTWSNIGLYDTTYTVYLHLPPGADADTYLVKAEDIESLNKEQSRFQVKFSMDGFIGVDVTGPELDHPWRVLIGPDWLFEGT